MRSLVFFDENWPAQQDCRRLSVIGGVWVWVMSHVIDVANRNIFGGFIMDRGDTRS